MKKFWIVENFRGHGYWTEAPNIAKAVERFVKEITYKRFGLTNIQSGGIMVL